MRKTHPKSTVSNRRPDPHRAVHRRFVEAFCEAVRPAPGGFTAGVEAASERITAKLPRLVAVALLAADVRTTDKQFEDVAAVLQMLARHDVERLRPPEQPDAKALPKYLRRWS